MFLLIEKWLPKSRRLPHARGGVSYFTPGTYTLTVSSPRPWGCFSGLKKVARVKHVFPTPVGVFPGWSIRRALALGLPHARGGVSHIPDTGDVEAGSSPRPWGCFLRNLTVGGGCNVFPTPVGVFLARPSGRLKESRLPHARGGVSGQNCGIADLNGSSPRPWGCFLRPSWRGRLWIVFPTPVGVFPPVRQWTGRVSGLPHARGGVSYRLCG